MHGCAFRQCRPEVERSGTGGRHWRGHCFRGWRAIPEAAVRTDRVVVPAPGLDQRLGLSQGIEDLAVQKLVTQRAVERLAVAVLPRAAWRNRLHPYRPRRGQDRGRRAPPLRSGRSHLQARLRIQRAQRSLAETADPSAKIALRSGYSDQAHFHRTLTALPGTTPARVRAAAGVRGSEVIRPLILIGRMEGVGRTGLPPAATRSSYSAGRPTVPPRSTCGQHWRKNALTYQQSTW